MLARTAVFSALLAAGSCALAQTNATALTTNSVDFVFVTRGGLALDSGTTPRFHAQVVARGEGANVARAFNQAAVKQDAAAARFGPDPKRPYFTVRFAMPIPP